MTAIVLSAELERCGRQLAKATTAYHWKVGADKAAALLEYSKRRDHGTALHARAWELVQLANRGLGAIVAALPKGKPGRKGAGIVLPEEKQSKGAELKTLKLTAKRAAELEKLAALPAAEFKARLDAGKAKITKLAEPSSVTATSAASEHDGDGWGTPGDPWITAARDVLGGIELDPASNPAANKVVQAERFYTKKQNGLTQEWKARTVWLNPPFSNPLVAQFEGRFVDEFEAGHFSAGITLVNNATETAWFQRLLGLYVCCFPDARIPFLDAQGKPVKGTRQGQALFYGGPNVERFAERFKEYGRIVAPYGR